MSAEVNTFFRETEIDKMSSSDEICVVKLKSLLHLPISSRLLEIQHLFDGFNSKELCNAFSVLVEDMFGTDTGVGNEDGWELRRTFQSNSYQDFHYLVDFLRPQGLFFQYCYKLVSSSNHYRYDFPLGYLPAKVKALIEEGMVPAFYLDKLKVDQQTRVPTAISLNSFEFYMFHFAYHLVNPWLVCNNHSRDLWDTVYLHLAEEYVAHFLPCSDAPVQPILGYFMSNSFSTVPLQASSRPVKMPTLGLFRQSVLLSQTLASSSYTVNSSPTSSQQNTRVEIWRSEVVSQVFIDFWLSCEDYSSQQVQMSPEPCYSPSPFSTPGGHSPKSFNMQSIQAARPPPLHRYPQLPSMEHMRVVRNLLKHIHYFANSFSGSGTSMDELKRIILPSSQGKIYAFLRRMIDQWPLDSSFRLVLETWLSYIQPWRYTGSWTHVGHVREADTQAHPVDRKWLNFIAENLLVYTVIFHRVLRRFSRLDLVMPKNAVMLFRTTKVFSQPGLSKLVAESESCLDDSVSLLTMSHKLSAIVRQQVLELEGPSYQYMFLFGPYAKEEMVRFCNFVNQAQLTAYALQKVEEFERKKYPTSFLTMIGDFFWNKKTQYGDYSLEDRTKVTAYLELSIGHLCSMFKIEDFPMSRPENSMAMPGGNRPQPPAQSPVSQPEEISFQQDSSMPTLQTPSPISPEAARKRLRQIRYEGDPDLLPINSSENVFLVRLLFQISSKLNEMYSEQMGSYYYRDDFYGHVARLVLCPPTITRSYDKRFPGRHSPRLEVCLPPRLSLRRLADYRVLMYLALAGLVAYLRGLGPVAFVFFAVLAWVVFIVVRAFASTAYQVLRPPEAGYRVHDSMLDASFST